MRATFQPKTHQRNIHPTPYNGPMAPSLRSRKYLECFYCGKRSTLRYDGFMTRWDCKNCDSTNFLDQNGQITDPPVATDSPVSRNVQYAIPRPNSPPRLQNSDSSLFCKTCMKNQHLFAASIAQYDIELDTRDPQYRQKEKDFFAYRKRLEKTYPQVCQDCEPRVQSRLREAGMTAKADHLRRMMDKSRARRGQKSASMTRAGIFSTVGKTLWYMGLLGQLSWSAGILLANALDNYVVDKETPENGLVSTIGIAITYLTSQAWIRGGMTCSVLAVWWNPMFYQMKTGFVNHIAGFGNWYKLQALIIISRSIFYSISGTGVLADPYSQANIAAHTVMLFYIVLLAYRAKQSLKVDMTPLWQSNQGKLVDVQPKVHSSNTTREPEGLADILDSIAATPARNHSNALDSPLSGTLPHQTTIHTLDRRKPFALDDSPTPTPRNAGRNLQILSHTTTSDTLAQYTRGDEMDWESQPVQATPPRAFRPLVSSGQENRPFSHAPASENANPFWYKIPPAPKTQAEKIWNPPQEPKLHAYSPEVKENYFNTLTKKNLGLTSKRVDDSQEMKLRPPKFFAPSTKSEVGTSLANMLTSISLDTIHDEEDEPMEVNTSGWRFRWDHLGQSIALLMGLWFWSHAFKNPDENSKTVLLAVLTGCSAIGARTLINPLLFVQGTEKSQIGQWAGIASGVVEILASIWGIVEVTVGRADRENFSSLGTILIAGMLVQEFWYASFG